MFSDRKPIFASSYIPRHPIMSLQPGWGVAGKMFDSDSNPTFPKFLASTFPKCPPPNADSASHSLT